MAVACASMSPGQPNGGCRGRGVAASFGDAAVMDVVARAAAADVSATNCACAVTLTARGVRTVKGLPALRVYA